MEKERKTKAKGERERGDEKALYLTKMSSIHKDKYINIFYFLNQYINI